MENIYKHFSYLHSDHGLRCLSANLKHLLDQSVDLVTLLAASATLVEVVELLANHTALGGGELDGPKEVGDSLELRTDGENLVDNVLNALEALVAKTGLNNSVRTNRHALSGQLHVASLVEEILHGLKVGVTVSNERFN